MAELGRRVGIGLAARGDVREAAAWARRAEDLGIDSIWVHDSYFERDPITYLSAIGMETRRIGLGAGALNPYTRHPVVVAMTMSALDDLAPRRVTLALGSGLPLRLSQMAIPYDDTVARVSESIDQIRRLWSGQPLKLNDKVPALQPMFQPPHRIPVYIAAYRTPCLDRCGEKADGDLARPAESLPAFQKMRARVLESAAAHGRTAGDVDFRGYLLCLFDSSRQEALNRAKREPFVIYMISVLSDISMKRAGFDPALRSQIATAWRAEDYHLAAGLGWRRDCARPGADALAALHRGAPWGAGVAHRDQRHQRDLRRPAWHRLDHVAPNVDGDSQGPDQRARCVRCGLVGIHPCPTDGYLPRASPRLALRAARIDRRHRRAFLFPSTVPVQVPGAGPPTRLPLDGAPDGGWLVLRGDRRFRPESRGRLAARRIAGHGDPARERMARRG